MKRIYAIEAWCVDCRRCEVACKTFHSKSRDTVRAFRWNTPCRKAAYASRAAGSCPWR